MLNDVPAVTTDDLFSFHQKHFLAQPTSTSGTPAAVDSRSSHEEVHNGDDDDLGYYPDGVKRTLTDEQIAMFRHSEIQSHLRERRLLRENADVEDPPSTSEQLPRSKSTSGPDTGDKGSAKRSASASGSQKTSNKRKWQRYIDMSDTNPEHLTHRRLAREMDEQRTKSIDLAYGDDDTSYDVPGKHPGYPTASSNSRQQVSYKDSEDFDTITSGKQSPATFVWPVLGAEPPI